MDADANANVDAAAEAEGEMRWDLLCPFKCATPINGKHMDTAVYVPWPCLGESVVSPCFSLVL